MPHPVAAPAVISQAARTPARVERARWKVYGGDTCEEADHARKYHEPVVVLGSQTGQDSEHAVHAYRVLFWRMVAATRVLPVKTGRPTLDILNGALAFVWNGAHLIVAPSQADSSRPRESGFLNIR